MEDGPLHWMWKNRTRSDRSQPVGVVLGGLVGSIWFRQQKHLGQIATILREILPSELADHLAIDGLRRNTLVLRVDSAPHRYELEMLKDSLLETLNEQINGVFIREIRFTLGPLEESWASGPRTEARPEQYEN